MTKIEYFKQNQFNIKILAFIKLKVNSIHQKINNNNKRDIYPIRILKNNWVTAVPIIFRFTASAVSR
jgi:hypothetical protein